MNDTQVPVDYALAAPGICRVTLAVMDVSTRHDAALRQEIRDFCRERILDDVRANVVLAAEIGNSQRMIAQLEHLMKTAALGL